MYAYNHNMKQDKNALTAQEHNLFVFICDTDNWRHPSFSTMRKYLGHQSDGYVTHALKALMKKGYIGSDYKPMKQKNATSIQE